MLPSNPISVPREANANEQVTGWIAVIEAILLTYGELEVVALDLL